jgi:large repetitive protein
MIQFSSANYTEDESQTAVITITRTGNLSGTNSVNFSTVVGGTAAGGTSCSPGVDFIAVNAQPVVFVPGDASEQVTVQICSDTITEPQMDGETINMALSGSNLGTPSTALLTINDTASQFKNATPIVINNTIPEEEAPLPYPSNITVAGAPVTIGSMRVTLYDYSHSSPDNVDVLLVGPQGQKFILMADAGGTNPQGQVTLSFRDAGPSVLPDNGPLTTGNFEPTSWTTPIANFPAPAPAGPYSEPGSAVGGTGTQTLFGNFGLTNPNGTWSLYVRQQGGGTGAIQGGWGIEFQVPTAANASISGRVMTADGRPIRNATVTVTGNSLTEPLTFQTGSFGYFMFDNLRTGETYIVTVGQGRYVFQVPTRVVTLTENIADLDFIAGPPVDEMDR